jgi:hypothetical protein
VQLGSAVGTGLTALSAGVAGSPLVGAASKVTKLGTAATFATRATSALRIAGLALIGVPLTPAAAAASVAVAGVGVAYYRALSANNAYAESVSNTADALVQSKVETGAFSDEILTQSDAFQRYAEVAGEGNTNLDLFREAVIGGKSAVGELQSELIDLNSIDIDLGNGITSSTISSDAQYEIAKTGEAVQALRDQLKESRDAYNDAAVDAGFLSFKHQVLSQQIEIARGNFAQITDVMDGVVDANIATRLATAQTNVALRNLDTTLGNLGTKKGKFTDQGFLDFTAAFTQIRDLSTQLASVGRLNAAEKALNGFRKELRGLVVDGDLSRSAYERLLDQLNLTPSEVEVRVGIQGIQAAAADLAQLKSDRLELLATGEFDENDKIILQYDADIAAAEDKLGRLNAKFNGADATTLDVDADTTKADKVFDQFGVGRRPVSIEATADMKKATDRFNEVLNKKYGVTIDTDADTKKASTDLEAVANKAYKALVRAGADTDDAANQIERLINKQYGTKVDVTADTSGFTAAVNAAATGLQYEINANSQGLVSVRALATGGILPGYAPGRDIIPALLSPGEAVLRPQAVRALGPDFINALNRDWKRVSQALRSAWSGNMPKFATGGIVGTGSLSLDEFGSLTAAIVSASRTSNAVQAAASGSITSGDTYIINPAPGMDEVELAAMVSRRQAFKKRRGS